MNKPVKAGNSGLDIQYSIIVPTYRRQDILQLCLEHLTKLSYDMSRIEIRVYDNGAPQESRSIAESFIDKHPVVYVLNSPGHGLGYSLIRGAWESSGKRIIELNDDAIVPADLLTRFDEIFDSDPRIGVIGVRAVEDGYRNTGEGIGNIDLQTGEVVGNFNIPADCLLDVDHVYGFCYAYKRDLLNRGARHDEILLSKDYSSGNRLETDHCLTAKRLGFRVVYDGCTAVRHLARPRADMSELSLRWHRNHIRNTLYLYLKNFGLFGKKFLALRFTFLKDVGIVSALKKPTKTNLMYFLNGLRSRLSAYGHYFTYLTRKSLNLGYHSGRNGR